MPWGNVYLFVLVTLYYQTRKDISTTLFDCLNYKINLWEVKKKLLCVTNTEIGEINVWVFKCFVTDLFF